MINYCLILLIFILLFIINYQVSKKKEYFTEILDITICIACHPPYINKLKYLLKSINNSNYYPKSCIIGLSETSDIDKNKLEKEFNKKYNFKIIITNSEKKCYQAENRNRAINLARTKYITICDSDDIVHKNRLKKIYDIMEHENCMALLHGFNRHNNRDISNDWHLKKKFSVMRGKELYNNMKITEGKQEHLSIKKIHHVYITFKRNVFNKIKQNENQKYYRKEDSKFVRDILKYYGNKENTMVFYDIPLVAYF